jgi:integrase
MAFGAATLGRAFGLASRNFGLSIAHATNVSTTSTASCRRLEGAERGRKTGYAFRGSASKLDYSNWRKKHWLPALELAGLAPLRFHDLRHTYASFLVAAGYSIAEIAVLMGHEDPSTTMIYAHLLPPVDPERLGRALPRLG